MCAAYTHIMHKLYSVTYIEWKEEEIKKQCISQKNIKQVKMFLSVEVLGHVLLQIKLKNARGNAGLIKKMKLSA